MKVQHIKEAARSRVYMFDAEMPTSLIDNLPEEDIETWLGDDNSKIEYLAKSNIIDQLKEKHKAKIVEDRDALLEQFGLDFDFEDHVIGDAIDNFFDV